MLSTVERGEMRDLGVSSVMSAARPRMAEKILTLVLSHEGRAKNPAFLIFRRGAGLNSPSLLLINFSLHSHQTVVLRRERGTPAPCVFSRPGVESAAKGKDGSTSRTKSKGQERDLR
jgi:hypothetical protein